MNMVTYLENFFTYTVRIATFETRTRVLSNPQSNVTVGGKFLTVPFWNLIS